MDSTQWLIHKSNPLHGTVEVDGAKNAVLVIIASLIMTRGVSRLTNVPASSDVYHMIHLIEHLGGGVSFDMQQKTLTVNTQHMQGHTVPPEIMEKMRASILVMGPLLSRIGCADVTMPGGCVIGKRPIDMHLRAFERLGVDVTTIDNRVHAFASSLSSDRIVFDYPSVGATENILMLAAQTPGETQIINAALEPEVLDLVTVLRKMGASIIITAPATIYVDGVDELQPVEHNIVADRLEAGTLLLAAAGTHGHVYIPNAPANLMDVFLEKLREMGHYITTEDDNTGVALQATTKPYAVSLRTMPYPGFPTDLQAPLMAVATCASGVSTIWETVYENRMLHVAQLNTLGAHISADAMRAHIQGVEQLYGNYVHAPDIRGGAALLIAGLMASGQTVLSGIEHLKRGHHNIDTKLQQLGAEIATIEDDVVPKEDHLSGRQVLG